MVNLIIMNSNGRVLLTGIIIIRLGLHKTVLAKDLFVQQMIYMILRMVDILQFL